MTGIEYQEEESCEGGKDWKIPEVAVTIGPRSEPIRDPPHLAHVRRRRQGANDDRNEQGERESNADKL